MAQLIGIYFGLGLGALTFLEMIFLALRIKITPLSFLGIAITILIVLWFFLRKSGNREPKPKDRNFNLLSKFLILLMVAQVLWVIVKAFSLQVPSDDAAAIWSPKAKIIYTSNLSGDGLSLMAKKMQGTLSGNYPLLVPLAENLANPKIISPLFYFSLLLAFFGILKKFTNKSHALIFTFFLSTLPFFANAASDAQADVPFTYYYVLAFLLILLWIKDRGNHYLYLAAIFQGLALWTKNEGYASLLINSTVIMVFAVSSRKKEIWMAVGKFILICLAFVLIVTYYQHLTGVKEGIINRETFTLTNLTQNFSRLPAILYHIQREFFGTLNRWNLLGFLFIFALILNWKNALKPLQAYLLLAIALNFALYIMVYLFSPQVATWHMATSLNRVLMHFTPLMLFLSAILMA